MFDFISIKNYQSIRDLKLDLKPFTVIVGASDSGKSAFFRALNTLIFNKRGADFITHGEKLCTIKAYTEEGSLTLQRGKSTNDNFYEIQYSGNPIGEKFTKLSGTVPEEVSNFLKISSTDRINFANQFDKPYLLDSKEYGPSEVARILGSLTNVNILFEGARESNKRKSTTSSTLKIREADKGTIESQLKEFEDLEQRSENLSLVEKDLAELSAKAEKLEELKTLTSEIQDSEDNIKILREEASREIPDISKVYAAYENSKALNETLRSIEEFQENANKAKTLSSIHIPDIAKLESNYQAFETLSGIIYEIEQCNAIVEANKAKTEITIPSVDVIEKQEKMLHELQRLIFSIETCYTQKDQAKSSIRKYQEEITELEEELHSILQQEGKCPTCGQVIKSG